jgi:tRNA (guanine10-N2)-methyltransferase
MDTGEAEKPVRLLCVFRLRYIEFRTPELVALIKLATGLECRLPGEKSAGEREKCFRLEYPKGGEKFRDNVFWYLVAPTRGAALALARVIPKRSVLVRKLIDLWEEGSTFEEVVRNLKNAESECENENRKKQKQEENQNQNQQSRNNKFESVQERKSRLACFQSKESTFKFICDAFGRTMSSAEQLDLINAMRFLDFKGKVKLNDPDCKFYIGHASPCEEVALPDMQNHWYFGEYLAKGTSFYDQYRLSERAYLGPTSMDHEMAAIMANMAQVTSSSVVFDPYVGTGSILVAAASLGAMTWGGDIDIRVVTWGKTTKKGGKVDVWSNFAQYGLERPVALLRCDAHLPPFRTEVEEIFDALVCDPPYGIRAGGRKSGGREKVLKKRETHGYWKEIPKDMKDAHIPSTAVYELSELLIDLLDMASKLLTVGGRLVYFFPSTNGIVMKDYLPSHPCLTVEHCSEQGLTQLWGRKLITMVKHAPWDEGRAREHRERVLSPGSDLRKCDNLHGMVFKLIDGEDNAQNTTNINKEEDTLVGAGAASSGGGQGEPEAAARPHWESVTSKRYRGKRV